MDKDIEDMTPDEWNEYFEDIKSGYAFDPDNELLERDKSMTLNDFFKSLHKEVDDLRFGTTKDFAKIISRIYRIFGWMQPQINEIDLKIEKEYKRRLSGCG